MLRSKATCVLATCDLGTDSHLPPPRRPPRRYNSSLGLWPFATRGDDRKNREQRPAPSRLTARIKARERDTATHAVLLSILIHEGSQSRQLLRRIVVAQCTPIIGVRQSKHSEAKTEVCHEQFGHRHGHRLPRCKKRSRFGRRAHVYPWVLVGAGMCRRTGLVCTSYFLNFSGSTPNLLPTCS